MFLGRRRQGFGSRLVTPNFYLWGWRVYIILELWICGQNVHLSLIVIRAVHAIGVCFIFWPRNRGRGERTELRFFFQVLGLLWAYVSTIYYIWSTLRDMQLICLDAIDLRATLSSASSSRTIYTTIYLYSMLHSHWLSFDLTYSSRSEIDEKSEKIVSDVSRIASRIMPYIYYITHIITFYR